MITRKKKVVDDGEAALSIIGLSVQKQNVKEKGPSL
jgi:hypothetical protein